MHREGQSLLVGVLGLTGETNNGEILILRLRMGCHADAGVATVEDDKLRLEQNVAVDGEATLLSCLESTKAAYRGDMLALCVYGRIMVMVVGMATYVLGRPGQS